LRYSSTGIVLWCSIVKKIASNLAAGTLLGAKTPHAPLLVGWNLRHQSYWFIPVAVLTQTFFKFPSRLFLRWLRLSHSDVIPGATIYTPQHRGPSRSRLLVVVRSHWIVETDICCLRNTMKKWYQCVLSVANKLHRKAKTDTKPSPSITQWRVPADRHNRAAIRSAAARVWRGESHRLETSDRCRLRPRLPTGPDVISVGRATGGGA